MTAAGGDNRNAPNAMSGLSPAPPFDWGKVAWGKPDSPVRDLCAYCHGPLPEVPLMIWKEDGHCARFCDEHATAAFGTMILRERR